MRRRNWPSRIERQPAEVVAVQVRYHDDRNVVGFETAAFEPAEGARPAVDQEPITGRASERLQMQAGLKPAAIPERVT
ncbi:hypothetical protein GCM10029978_081800 [Actinoallomurus acanthiterrae]